MFELITKLGSQNYKELINIIDSQINANCFDSIDKIAIIKLLERLYSISEGSSIKAELVLLFAQTAFRSDSLSIIRPRVDEMTIENATKIICNMRPLQQIYVKSLFMTFRDIDKQNSNEKIYMDAIFNMLSLNNPKKYIMENESKEKMAIYCFLILVAYSEEPITKYIIDYLEFVVEQHLGMTKYECDQALNMKEDEVGGIIRNLSINKKKALFIDASKIAMTENVKKYNGDVFSLLKSKRLQRLIELNQKYDIPDFQF